MTKAAPRPHSPSFLVVIIAGTVTVFFCIAIIREFIQSQGLHRQLSRLRQEVATEEDRQQELRELLAYLASPTFQERQARLELGLKAEGERVVVVPSTLGQEDQAAADSRTELNRLSNPGKWWYYFFASEKAVQ